MAYKKDATLAKSMGSVIRGLRLKKYPGHGGQIKCAADFGVSQSEWSHWERGTKTPSAINQKRIADHFAVNVGVLWGEGPVTPLYAGQPPSTPNPNPNPFSRIPLLQRLNSTQTENSSFILDLYRLATRVQAHIFSLLHHAESSPAGLSQAITTLTVVDNTLERTSPDHFPPPAPAMAPPSPPYPPLRPPAYAKPSAPAYAPSGHNAASGFNAGSGVNSGGGVNPAFPANSAIPANSGIASNSGISSNSAISPNAGRGPGMYGPTPGNYDKHGSLDINRRDDPNNPDLDPNYDPSLLEGTEVEV